MIILSATKTEIHSKSLKFVLEKYQAKNKNSKARLSLGKGKKRNNKVTWSQNVIHILMASKWRERERAVHGRVRFVLECTKITTSGSRSDI